MINNKVSGFGFNQYISEHHFEVLIPTSKTKNVMISEHMLLQTNNKVIITDDDNRLRVIISRDKWDVISDVVKDEFNRRLRQSGHKRGKWKQKGTTLVYRLFGKELVLLAWGIESVDLSVVHTAIINWKGLMPEERWWLYTMTNAATGQAVSGKNIGWRKAVKYILADNPTNTGVPDQRMGLF